MAASSWIRPSLVCQFIGEHETWVNRLNNLQNRNTQNCRLAAYMTASASFLLILDRTQFFRQLLPLVPHSWVNHISLGQSWQFHSFPQWLIYAVVYDPLWACWTIRGWVMSVLLTLKNIWPGSNVSSVGWCCVFVWHLELLVTRLWSWESLVKEKADALPTMGLKLGSNHDHQAGSGLLYLLTL